AIESTYVNLVFGNADTHFNHSSLQCLDGLGNFLFPEYPIHNAVSPPPTIQKSYNSLFFQHSLRATQAPPGNPFLLFLTILLRVLYLDSFDQHVLIVPIAWQRVESSNSE